MRSGLFGWSMVLGSSLALGGCGDDGGEEGAGGAGGSSSSSEIPCASPADPDGGKVACPGGSPQGATALTTLAALRAIAADTGEPTRWLGGILGQQIGQNGMPSTEPLTIWIAGFCLGEPDPITSDANVDDGLSLATNGSECIAERTCTAIDCAASQNPAPPEPTPPVVDSDAAIAAAFPGDPAGTLYGVSYTAQLGDYWAISSSASGTTVNVDGTTGQVVP